MKLILSIVNHNDAHAVISQLTHGGFQVTKLATTGGFLMAGNVTILIGVDDGRIDAALEIIRKHSYSRKKPIPTSAEFGVGSMLPTVPVDVIVGGATVFVLNVEKFEKM